MTLSNADQQVQLSLIIPEDLSGRVYLSIKLPWRNGVYEIYLDQVTAGAVEHITLTVPEHTNRLLITYLAIDHETHRTMTREEEIWVLGVEL
jgi:hypothetical protein